MSASARRLWLALSGTIVLATLVYLVRLGAPTWGDQPKRYVFDEKYTAFTAHRVLLGDPAAFQWAARRYQYAARDTGDLTLSTRAEWTSPPGAPLAVVPFIAALGYSAPAARLASVLAALIVLIATASLAGLRRAWCACALLAFDGVFFVLARTAMPYIFLAAGVTAGAAVLAWGLRRPDRRWVAAVVAGMAFGFATSVRLTAVPLAGLILVALAASKEGVRQRFQIPSLIVVPVAAAIYLLTFLPYLSHGHGLSDLWHFHRAMAWFHAHVPREFPQASRWFEWPWALHPVIFTTRRVAENTAVVWCAGGRLLWWPLVPVLVYGIWLARNRDHRYMLPVAAIVGTFLPWVALDRFGLSHYLLPALPFVSILIATSIDERRLWRFAPVYVGLAIAQFVLVYPVLASVPLSEPALRRYGAWLGVESPTRPAASVADANGPP